MIVLMDGRARYDPDRAIIVDASKMNLEEAINEARERGDDTVVVETDGWSILWTPELDKTFGGD
jgi:Mg-chelatase subunit ChlD